MQRATSTFFSFFFFFYFLLLLFPPTTNLIDGISTLSIGAGRSFDHGKKMEKIDFIFFDCLRNSPLFSRWKKRLEETRRFVRLNFERCENEILRGTIGNNLCSVPRWTAEMFSLFPIEQWADLSRDDPSDRCRPRSDKSNYI